MNNITAWLHLILSRRVTHHYRLEGHASDIHSALQLDIKTFAWQIAILCHLLFVRRCVFEVFYF